MQQLTKFGLPLRAFITAGNRYDGSFLPKLIEDLNADYVLADADYYSKWNIEAIKDVGAAPVIADNPRKEKRCKIKPNMLLRKKRYVVEQFNGYMEANVLGEC